MKFGTVKYFDPEKGYGLIACEDGGREIVVHQADVDQARLGQLAVRQRLGFDVAGGRARRRAVNLWATFGNR